MEELFGVSMNTIAAVVVAITAVILVLLAFVAVRNPVMFKTGLRNIPRRRAQTTLIIFGLMLATVIMTAAFGTGDTVSSTVTDDIYELTGETDMLIVWDEEGSRAPRTSVSFPLRKLPSGRSDSPTTPTSMASSRSSWRPCPSSTRRRS